MPAPGRWMDTAKLRMLLRAGVPYKLIAEINLNSEGWQPTVSAVSRKAKAMGESRRMRHDDLLPWEKSAGGPGIRPEHNKSRIRYYLQVESARRQGKELNIDEESAVRVLYNLLFGRGIPQVVCYHPEIGFYLQDKQDTDTDIVRAPQPSPVREVREPEPVRPAELDLSLDDQALAVAAREAGIPPEHLENVGRDGAADILRNMIFERAAGSVIEIPFRSAVTVSAAQARHTAAAGDPPDDSPTGKDDHPAP